MGLSIMLFVMLATPLVIPLIMTCLPFKGMPIIVFEILHVICIVVVVCTGAYLVVAVMSSGQDVFCLGQWFRMDPLGAVFVAMVAVIGFLCGIHSLAYVRHDLHTGELERRRVRTYYIFFDIFIFTMLVASVANNIVLMWIAIEGTTLSTIFLVGSYNKSSSLEAAWKYAIVCTCGVAFGLYATILVYADANSIMDNATDAVFWSSLLPYAKEFNGRLVSIAFVFAAVGFGTKAGLFPMNTWLPDAHSESAAPVSAMLSGVLLACAMCIIMRFYTLTVECVGALFPQIVMMVMGILTIGIAAFSLFAQNDIKRKFAYSSCENIGVIGLCLGFGGPLGVAAALLHCVFHGFTKALMFCLSGNVVIRYGTRDLTKVRGVIYLAPITGTLMALGLFALSGLPAFAMFISEMMAFIAGIVQGYIWLVVVLAALLTVVIAAFSHILTANVLSPKPEGEKRKEVSPVIIIPEIAMIAVIVWFGVSMPQPFVNGIESATAEVTENVNIDELHEAPLFHNIFSTTEPVDEPRESVE